MRARRSRRADCSSSAATTSGRLTALDKADGTQLWEYQTDAGIHAAVSTFEHDGRRYVVANSAGSFFPGTTRGDSVYLFAVDGAARPEQHGRRLCERGGGTEARALAP